MKKKIAFVNNQIFVPWGGSEILWYQAALLLRQQGHEVYVYFPKWPDLPKEAKILEQAGCILTYYNFIRGYKDKITSNLPFNFLKKNLVRDRANWLSKIKPDMLVLTNLAPRGKEWMQAAFNTNTKYVLVSQLSDETLWHTSEELQNSDFLYTKASKIYMLSEENKIATEKQLAIKLVNVARVYNPFNVDVHKPFSYPELIEGKFHLACVARLGIEHKRQDILLEILSDGKWKNREVHLNIYGKGVHEKSLHKLATYYGLKNVTFCGHVSDINSVWEKNHAFVLPSRYEGVSLAMQEALISYKTCIVSQVGGVSELVIDNITGFIAPAATTPLFAEAMERAWLRKSEWKEMGFAAGNHIRKILPEDPTAYFVKELLAV